MHFTDIDVRSSFLLYDLEFPGLYAHLAADQQVVCVAVGTVAGTYV